MRTLEGEKSAANPTGDAANPTEEKFAANFAAARARWSQLFQPPASVGAACPNRPLEPLTATPLPRDDPRARSHVLDRGAEPLLLDLVLRPV